MATVNSLDDPPRERSDGPLGAYSTRPVLRDSEDVEEFPLLLQSEQVRALIEVARHQGLTAVGLARCLIGDYLRRTSNTLPAKNSSAGGCHS
jgi:hypothetical protein